MAIFVRASLKLVRFKSFRLIDMDRKRHRDDMIVATTQGLNLALFGWKSNVG